MLLDRFQVAAVKRTAQTVKSMRRKKASIEAKLAKLSEELGPIEKSIDAWEEPIIAMTGGYTSEQVLEEGWGITKEIETEVVNVNEAPEVESPIEEEAISERVDENSENLSPYAVAPEDSVEAPNVGDRPFL